MRWEGTIVAAGEDWIKVRRHEYPGNSTLHCDSDRTVRWMHPGKIWAACVGSPVFWNRIEVGRRTGFVSFTLREIDVIKTHTTKETSECTTDAPPP